ncbi:MAG: hypothetical protein QXF06_00450 [Archaeoglobaceae archaeon]
MIKTLNNLLTHNEQISVNQAENILDEALEIARSITEEYWRSWALIKLAETYRS